MRKTLLVVLLGLAVASCGDDDSAAAASTTTTAPVALAVTEADNGQERTLALGERLTVTLPTNPSTGYSWRIAELDEQVVRQAGEPDYRPDETSSPAPGVGGQAVLTFIGNSEGVAALSLEYARPWEQGIEPAQKFSLMITVQ